MFRSCLGASWGWAPSGRRRIFASKGTEFAKTARNDDGGVTVEFVIWFPFIVGLAALIADLSLIFTTNANMYDTARDAARQMAVNRADPSEAEAYVLSHLLVGKSSEYTVTATDGADVTVEIRTSIKDASVFGAYAALLPGDLSARVTMMKEPQ